MTYSVPGWIHKCPGKRRARHQEPKTSTINCNHFPIRSRQPWSDLWLLPPVIVWPLDPFTYDDDDGRCEEVFNSSSFNKKKRRECK